MPHEAAAATKKVGFLEEARLPATSEEGAALKQSRDTEGKRAAQREVGRGHGVTDADGCGCRAA